VDIAHLRFAITARHGIGRGLTLSDLGARDIPHPGGPLLSSGRCVVVARQTVLPGLAAALLERPEVLLLDEPTNNLDLFARRRLYAALDSWRSGVLVVVSHDQELLERVDRIAELRLRFGQPRPALPRIGRHHPLAAAGWRTPGDHLRGGPGPARGL
jgi:putative AbiEii toxin of type IV toxin-antitoxin system